MKGLLAWAFFITAVAGFAADLLQLNVQPLGRGFFWPVFFGAGAVVGLVATIKRLRSPVLIFIVVGWIGGGLAGLGWWGWASSLTRSRSSSPIGRCRKR
jgi:hypothetical protein